MSPTKIATLLGLLGGVVVVVLTLPASATKPARVTICHKPGTPAEKTLTLPPRAAAHHIKNQGDTPGPCLPCPGGRTPTARKPRVAVCVDPGTPAAQTVVLLPAAAARRVKEGAISGPCPCVLAVSPASGPLGTVITLTGRDFAVGQEIEFDGVYRPEQGNPLTLNLVHGRDTVEVTDCHTVKLVVGAVLPTVDHLTLARLGTGILDGTVTARTPAGTACVGRVQFALTPSATFTDGQFKLASRLNLLAGGNVEPIPLAFRYFAQVQVPDSSAVTMRTVPSKLRVNVVSSAVPSGAGFAPTVVEMLLDLVSRDNGLLTYRAATPVVPFAAPLPASPPGDVVLLFADERGKLTIVVLGAG